MVEAICDDDMALKARTYKDGEGKCSEDTGVTAVAAVDRGSGGGGGKGGRSYRTAMAIVSPKLPKFETLAQEAEFMMYTFKVVLCTRRRRHAWSACPYAHPGETARRRDPRTHCAIPCSEMKQGMDCPRRDRCPYSHHDFEYWLHPTRYRTVMCNRGAGCSRVLCFFAHSCEELRLTAANRMPGTKPGLETTGEAKLDALEAAEGDCNWQDSDWGELNKQQDSEAGQDTNSCSAAVGQESSSSSSPVSSPDSDHKESSAEHPAKDAEEEEERNETGWTLTDKFVNKQVSTESLASLKIFSLLAKAAEIQESMHKGLRAGTHATSLDQETVMPAAPRPTRHARSRSLSTAGLDGVYSRVGCTPVSYGPSVDFDDQLAAEDGDTLKQRSYLSVGAYSPPLERSNSADIATLNQMLNAGDLSWSHGSSSYDYDSQRMGNREQKPVAGIPVDSAGRPVLQPPAATQSQMFSMGMQGGWGLAAETQFPGGNSAPLSQLGSLSSLYTGSGQNLMCGDLAPLSIENWQQMGQWVSEANLADLLTGQDGNMLDPETLRELQNMYFAPETISQVQNLLQGLGFPNIETNSALLGALAPPVPSGGSPFGGCDSQLNNVGGSTTASCVSDECILPRRGSQEVKNAAPKLPTVAP